MNKFVKNLIVGAASGAAAAYFLTTEKGKEFKQRAENAYKAYKENPDEYHQMAKEKANEYSTLAKDTFNDYKEKFESGELTKEDVLSAVKEKSDEVVDFASDLVSQVSSKFSDVKDKVVDDEVKEEAPANDDIIIDYTADEVEEKDNKEDKPAE